MTKGSQRRRTAPKRALIGPLVMLGAGMVVGVVVWHILMLPPARPVAAGWTAGEQISRHDRQALDQLFTEQRSRP
jgi:hypothetical protein